MWSCKLCENETVYVTHLCDKCRRVKHLLNLYGDRVYDVLESVLVRSESGQTHKIKTELKVEKEKINIGEEETAADNKESILTRSKSKYAVE